MKITIKYPCWSCPTEAKEVSFDLNVLHQNTDRVLLGTLFAGFGNHPYPQDEPLLLKLSEICRAERMRSMSVGDFVNIGETWYQCAPTGWIVVSEEKVNRVMALSQYDTWSDKDLNKKGKS